MPGDSLERNKEGIPAYDGSAEKLALFREEALAYTFTLEHHKRYLAGPRLAKELTGVARTVVRKKLAQDPQWLAHPRGAYVLIEYLEQAIETPTLVQASNHIHKFFYQLRRRKVETMTEWINRHSESMWEASRALRRVQKEHGVLPVQQVTEPPASNSSLGTLASSQQLSGGRSSWNSCQPAHDGVPGVFDENGRMAEDDDDVEADIGGLQQDGHTNRGSDRDGKTGAQMSGRKLTGRAGGARSSNLQPAGRLTFRTSCRTF